MSSWNIRLPCDQADSFDGKGVIGNVEPDDYFVFFQLYWIGQFISFLGYDESVFCKVSAQEV